MNTRLLTRLNVIIISLLSVLLLAACGASPTPTTSLGGGSPTQPPVVVQPVSGLAAPVAAGKTSDNLPTYTCAADAFASYYTLQVIQQSGLDVAHGFHLAIFPFDLTDKYTVNEDQRVQALGAGQWDCLLTTLDSVALNGNSGKITAIVDESAGADQLWVKGGIKTLNDLRGRKIAVDSGSVGEFFAYYVLDMAGVTTDPKTGATIVQADSVANAVKAFNGGQADVVSGYDPDIQDASKGGGTKLIDTGTLRVIVDVVVTARQSIDKRADVVQKFHDAWFDALKMAAEDLPKFAGSIAAWGNNKWTGINAATAKDDLSSSLSEIAQASLDANRIAMGSINIIQERIDQAKRVWAAAGVSTTDGPDSVIEPKFVLASAAQKALLTDKPLVNNTFYMTARPTFTALTDAEAAKAQTLAILPCRTFEFLPGKTDLTEQATQILSECVVPILHSSPDIYMTVLGSAAWPTNETEASVRDFALKRATAVANYLISQGINKERLVIQTTVPPPERRDLGDNKEDLRKQDRFVQLTLILSGR